MERFFYIPTIIYAYNYRDYLPHPCRYSPSNLNITVLSSGDNLLSVNLTWSQENSDYVVMYYDVEVTATNINTTNMTMSQHITLILQIGVVYSFRVRGADNIDRLGEWSDYFIYPSKLIKYMHTASILAMLLVYRYSASS